MSTEFKWHPEYEKSRASYSNAEIQAARHNWTKAVMYDLSLQKSASARIIAFALMDKFFNFKTGQCNPSHAKLGALFGLKLTATRDALKVLVKAGWIEIVERKDPDNEKHSLSNQYRLMKIEFQKRDATDQPAQNDNHPHRNSVGDVAESQLGSHRNPAGGGYRNSDTKPSDTKPSYAEPHERNQSRNARDEPDASGWPADAWDQFWTAYPNKVSKPVAQKSFTRVKETTNATFEAVMAGLSNYKNLKPQDRAWLNPATFLNQARWEDQPANVDDRSKAVRRMAI